VSALEGRIDLCRNVHFALMLAAGVAIFLTVRLPLDRYSLGAELEQLVRFAKRSSPPLRELRPDLAERWEQRLQRSFPHASVVLTDHAMEGAHAALAPIAATPDESTLGDLRNAIEHETQLDTQVLSEFGGGDFWDPGTWQSVVITKIDADFSKAPVRAIVSAEVVSRDTPPEGTNGPFLHTRTLFFCMRHETVSVAPGWFAQSYPSLDASWDVLARFRLSEAQDKAQDLLGSQLDGAGAIDWNGLNIRGKDLGLVIAPAILGLLGTLLAYVQDTERRLRKCARPTELPGYPGWFALFPTRLARFLSFVSVVILPGTAATLAVHRFLYSSPGVVVLWVVATVVGMLVYRDVSDISVQLDTPPAPAPAPEATDGSAPKLC